MLMLIFRIKDHWYALETTHVVEIVPRIPLREIPSGQPYLAGFLNYRGTIVPILDLARLIEQQTSCPHLSTRIMMIQYPVPQDSRLCHLGLIAEQVTETLNPATREIRPLNLDSPRSNYLGGMLLDDRGMIQCIDLDKLFSFLRSENALPTLPGAAPSLTIPTSP